MLFIGESEACRASATLNGVKLLPVLTVSDAKGFAHSGGMIELQVETGRRRFMINEVAAGRAGLRFSSRLLALATVSRRDPTD